MDPVTAPNVRVITPGGAPVAGKFHAKIQQAQESLNTGIKAVYAGEDAAFAHFGQASRRIEEALVHDATAGAVALVSFAREATFSAIDGIHVAEQSDGWDAPAPINPVDSADAVTHAQEAVRLLGLALQTPTR